MSEETDSRLPHNGTEENKENDGRQEDHLLSNLRRVKSESRTTNIPPRMPSGYVYAPTDEEKTQNDAYETAVSAKEPSTLLGTEGPDETQRQRYRHKKAAPKKHKAGWGKVLGRTVLVLVIASAVGGGGYYLWTLHNSMPPAEPQVVVPNDSFPKVEDTPDDTLLRARFLADSLRREDSLKEVHRQYWLKKKQQQEEEEALQSAESETQNASPTEHHPADSSASSVH